MSDGPAASGDTLAVTTLPREMTRVAELVTVYESRPLGMIAASIMRASLERAQHAIDTGDLAAMRHAYGDLKGYSL